MKTVSLLTTAALWLAVLPLSVPAANDGRLDESSLGVIEISLSILPSIQINTVTDIHLNINDRSVDAVFSESFCVVGNTGGRYTVLAEGSESMSNRFLLRNDEGEPLEYDVSFLGNPAGGEYDLLEPGEASPPYPLNTNASDCEGTTSFRIIFRSEDLKLAGSGLYSGSLTMVVSPV
ncbi:MAG: hypothetical protein HUJ31_17190 [Pseudomonadales bacterium]|nr:hypothetical protein [Pseudomonadales bacterium]